VDDQRHTAPEARLIDAASATVSGNELALDRGGGLIEQ
jgi:hypothetical protein